MLIMNISKSIGIQRVCCVPIHHYRSFSTAVGLALLLLSPDYSDPPV